MGNPCSLVDHLTHVISYPFSSASTTFLYPHAPADGLYNYNDQLSILLINSWCACTARVKVLGVCVCVCMCLSVCVHEIWHYKHEAAIRVIPKPPIPFIQTLLLYFIHMHLLMVCIIIIINFQYAEYVFTNRSYCSRTKVVEQTSFVNVSVPSRIPSSGQRL